jgi:hypothetical protein
MNKVRVSRYENFEQKLCSAFCRVSIGDTFVVRLLVVGLVMRCPDPKRIALEKT